MERRHFLRLAALSAAWPRPAWAATTVNDLHSQLNPTRVARVIPVDSLQSLRDAVKAGRHERRAVCVAGGRHAMGGQQFATDGVLVDTRPLRRVLAFDMDRGLIEVEAGLQWPELLAGLAAAQRGRERVWTFAQKQTGADRLTMGGSLSANIHGRGLTLPPFVGDVEAFTLLDAEGELRRCSRTENADLFRLAIGGYGLFGCIYSVTLRLVPRRTVERVVEVRDVEGLVDAFAGRVRDGYLYGDFQYAIDPGADDFMRRGVFSCYRPVDDTAPLDPARKELGEREWGQLLYLAHADKAKAFEAYAAYYRSTNGQRYWSDEHQMSYYPDDYHRALDRRLGSVPATEGITEIYCERAGLEAFMADVRAYARRDPVDIVYGTVRLIEPDRESFLAWANKPYACVIFNLHIEHTSAGRARARDAFRRLIDIGIAHGGSYYPTYHRHALRRQVEACYPQFGAFLAEKRRHDPHERFQSDWYRHYKTMFGA
jgi:FAD/FMN-containing dehydrogenase